MNLLRLQFLLGFKKEKYFSWRHCRRGRRPVILKVTSKEENWTEIDFPKKCEKKLEIREYWCQLPIINGLSMIGLSNKGEITK